MLYFSKGGFARMVADHRKLVRLQGAVDQLGPSCIGFSATAQILSPTVFATYEVLH